MCHRVVHRHSAPGPLDAAAARTLLGLGAWMTVSNVISPLMVNIDRFFVAAFLSIAAVAYYATPFEAVTKLLIIPSAIAAVLFPAFAAASVSNPERLRALYRRGLTIVLLAMYPLAFIVIAFAPELLRLWLGDTFARESATSLRWVALGVLSNSLAALPFALLQGVGRSDLTAKIHLIEFPIYLVLMVWLIRHYGINGAAIAWCIRTTLDLGLLSWWSARQFRDAGGRWFRDVGAAAVLMSLLALGVFTHSATQKIVLTTVLIGALSVVAWQWSVTQLRRAP